MMLLLRKNEITFHNVSVRALTPCRVVRYSFSSFRESFEKNPELWIRPIQIILTRLLHRPEDRRSVDERYRHPSGTAGSTRLHNKLRQRVRRLSSADGKNAADFSDVNDCLATAHRWFAEVLQLGTSSEAIALFENRLLIENVPEKHLIVEQNAEEEQLIMILSGVLEISQEPIDGEDEAVDDEHVFLYPRELVGGLQLL
ncbi:unnamed protein product, partial [Gongylonema pulchrum]|uniref:Cyclic nucleotide-binding domain-containing protein n=1 Tax=Gongylonema pulchrum TaxID=637853 RepID=A0A183EM28_9BILA